MYKNKQKEHSERLKTLREFPQMGKPTLESTTKKERYFIPSRGYSLKCVHQL
jgi:hypothetical protein